jgi:hypothetical protein
LSVVSVSRVRNRVVELLLASGRGARYTGAVSATDGNGRFEVTQEMTDAIIEADMAVCLACIETVGHPYRVGFLVASSSLANEDLLPSHVGADGVVKIDETGTGTFKDGILAESKDDLLEALRNPTLYPDSKRYYWLEDSQVVHGGASARVYYPSFTKNDAACQAHEAYTSAVIAGALAGLKKDAVGDDFIAYYARQFEMMLRDIKGRLLVIPETQQFEKAAA